MPSHDDADALLLLMFRLRDEAARGRRALRRFDDGRGQPVELGARSAPPAPAMEGTPRTMARGVPRTARQDRRSTSGRQRGPPQDQPPRWEDRFRQALERIATADGERGAAPTVVESEQVPNVGAAGQVVIVNPRWMDRVSKEICGGHGVCERELVEGIAGHEWSHIRDDAHDDGRSPRTSHQRELDADRTAGRILERGGSSNAPLKRLLESNGPDASSSHPAARDRTQAVSAGQAEARAGCTGQGTCTCEH